ncbi:MAG: 4'-phosphopantetheinyl transferase superfamily protein [Pyrinomonadaceae bacterium]
MSNLTEYYLGVLTLDAIDLNYLPIEAMILGPDDVHVWHASLDVRLSKNLAPVLSEDELTRAHRFDFAKDRHHYIAARGILRKLLAAYLGSDAAELKFSYADKGKPFLNAVSRRTVNFNLAHSHGRAVYAFSSGRELGVDIEFLREDLAEEKIAERFFSPSEVTVLREVPKELRNQAFFNCWTRKEAYIKARGEGLSMPLDEFDVSLTPGEPAALLKNHKDERELLRWSMQSLPIAPGYVAALVVEGHNWRLKRYWLREPTQN